MISFLGMSRLYHFLGHAVPADHVAFRIHVDRSVHATHSGRVMSSLGWMPARPGLESGSQSVPLLVRDLVPGCVVATCQEYHPVRHFRSSGVKRTSARLRTSTPSHTVSRPARSSINS